MSLDIAIYFNNFISKLPDNTIIYTGKNTKIDIKEKLLEISNKLFKREDGNIGFEIVPNKFITLDEYYQLLLKNEYKVPTLEDKQELVNSTLNLLRDIDSNFMSVYNSEMSTGIKFCKLINALAKYIDDNMNLVINGKTENVSEYIYNLYFYQVAYLDYKFNKSLDDPSKVPEFKVNNEHTVTGELPTILSSDDKKSLTSYKNSEEIELSDYYLLIPKLNIKYLEEVKSKIENYEPYNNYEKLYKEFLLDKINKRENILSESSTIIEDYKTIMDHKLDNLQKKIIDDKSIFERGFQDISDLLAKLNNEFNDILIECISYNIDENKKLENIRELLNEYEIKYNQLYNRKDRNKNRAIISLEEKIMKIRKKINDAKSSIKFNESFSNADSEDELYAVIKDFKRIIDDYYEKRLINNDEYQKWSNELNDLLSYYNFGTKKEGRSLL